jgi:curli biogenesis system outer membrane secretion channel CsgG
MSKRTALVLVLSVTAANAQPKKRVAVVDFDYATVQSNVSALFGSNQDVGKGVADILVDKLVSAGVYMVVERKQLDKVLAEQHFSNSDRADASSAAKIGRVLGIDYMIVGSITKFGNDDKKTDIGGGASTKKLPGGFGGLGVSKTESKAVVEITARMIDTSTAEIVASTPGHGEDSRKGTGIVGGEGTYSKMAAGALDMKSSNFENTILGTAVNKAVADAAQRLNEKAPALPERVVDVDGLVASASAAGVLIVNVGTRAGVKVGDHLAIQREKEVVRDPATGKVIRRNTDPIGAITVTEVDALSAVGKFEGSGKPKVGDLVTNKK